MKKIIFALLILCISINVKAQSLIGETIENEGFYLNKNNITITKELYEKVKDFTTEEELENMSRGLYELFEESSEIVAAEGTYIESTYYHDSVGNTFEITTEISEEEYNNQNIQPKIDCGSGCWKTDYKYIKMYIAIPTEKTYDDEYILSIYNTWNKMPQHRSYDIIAMRWTGTTTLLTYNGAQLYTSNGTDSQINYSSTSSNFNNTNKGVGLSQDLVNNAIEIENRLSIRVRANGTINLFGTYQHAQGTISLANSLSYSFGNGMGGVINFHSTRVSSVYDNTTGVTLTASL